MSSDNDVTTAELAEERLVAPLRNVKLEGVGKGKLSVTSQRLEFETKSGILSQPHVEFSIDLTDISSAKVKDDSLILEWLNEERQRVVRRLFLPKGDAATNLCRSLTNAIKLLKYEAELRERRARYQAFLWKAAYQIWVLGGLLLGVVQELTHEEWEAVDADLSEAREIAGVLSLEGACDIGPSIEGLIETTSSHDAPLVLRKLTATVEGIGKALHGEPPLALEWRELAEEVSSGLNWRDMPYLFLLAASYRLISLQKHLGAADNTDGSLPRLVRLASLLDQRLSLGSQISDVPGEEDASIVAGRIDELVQEIEGTLRTNAGAG